ncbi:MAG: hypothetical protein QXG00_05025 [Candidatus Woesearchaeota archaeon]
MWFFVEGKPNPAFHFFWIFIKMADELKNISTCKYRLTNAYQMMKKRH